MGGKIGKIDGDLKALAAEAIEKRQQRKAKAVANTQQELKRLRDELAALRGRLEHSDLQGLHARLAAARDRRRQTESELARQTERAEAARLLYETLQAAQREIRQAYLKPLRESVAALLQQLFPESAIEFGDQFQITQLSRGQRKSDDFERLSYGSREQLGIVVRLAMARLLASHGEPLPVFLDDVLTATDAERFERMADILAHVAADLQLIVATCHWSRFRGVGADRNIDLEATIRAAASAGSTAPSEEVMALGE